MQRKFTKSLIILNNSAPHNNAFDSRVSGIIPHNYEACLTPLTVDDDDDDADDDIIV